MMAISDDELVPVGSLLPKNLEWYDSECETHGIYRALRRTGDTIEKCPTCIGDEAAKADHEAAIAARKQHLFNISGIPKKFVESGFRNYPIDCHEQEVAIAVMRMYVRQVQCHVKNGSGMIVTGSIGAGKTRLACALANNAISKMVSVKYFTVADMLSEIKRAYSTDGMTEASQIYLMVNCADILILDEVDVNRGSETDNLLLFQVVNGRNLAMKPIISITNRAPDELGQYVGERTADRLRENAMIVTCGWPSYRKAI
jgi:DNA replication protein DnaC